MLKYALEIYDKVAKFSSWTFIGVLQKTNEYVLIIYTYIPTNIGACSAMSVCVNVSVFM